ncbi:MAG TPA: DUF1802 family protein [Pirellulales bacterium]|jgi:hypothetical protein
MLPSNHIAFKEWAVVCASLAAGRQTIILRKGGIDEGREGFRVQHREFWLLPTRFHQDPSQLTADGAALLRQMQSVQLPTDHFQIELYAAVEQVFEVRNLDVLHRLAGQHILAEQTVDQRFHYRHPGLFVLAARIYRLPKPITFADSPYIAGCKSWVELPTPMATDKLLPVLEEQTFQIQLHTTQRQLQSADAE